MRKPCIYTGGALLCLWIGFLPGSLLIHFLVGCLIGVVAFSIAEDR